MLVLDDENRARFRDVSVARVRDATLFVSGGLDAGERVVISAIETVVDGMAVTPVEVTPDELLGQSS